LVDDKFPADALRDAGWKHLAWWGQPTYNGVAIVSRLPLQDVQLGMGLEIEEGQPRVVSATVGGVKLIGVYVPNGQRVGHARFDWKLRWLTALHEWIDTRCTPAEPVMLCGDLNIAPDDLDVWDPFATDGKLLCHPGERQRFQAFIDWGFRDPYREANPFSNAFTWWDYRQMGFSRNQGMRIDHTLLTDRLAEVCTDVRIWRDVRGWDQPSDHVPVSVDLEL
jgi:exodeoxyribonuclease-3